MGSVVEMWVSFEVGSSLNNIQLIIMGSGKQYRLLFNSRTISNVQEDKNYMQISPYLRTGDDLTIITISHHISGVSHNISGVSHPLPYRSGTNAYQPTNLVSSNFFSSFLGIIKYVITCMLKERQEPASYSFWKITILT